MKQDEPNKSDLLLALVERIAVALEAIAAGGGKLMAAGAQGQPKPRPAAARRVDPLAKAEPEPPRGTIPDCPQCGEPMLFRTRKTDGNQFWGCRKFPACRGVRNMDGSTGRQGRSGAAVPPCEPGEEEEEPDGLGEEF